MQHPSNERERGGGQTNPRTAPSGWLMRSTSRHQTGRGVTPWTGGLAHTRPRHISRNAPTCTCSHPRGEAVRGSSTASSRPGLTNQPGWAIWRRQGGRVSALGWWKKTMLCIKRMHTMHEKCPMQHPSNERERGGARKNPYSAPSGWLMRSTWRRQTGRGGPPRVQGARRARPKRVPSPRLVCTRCARSGEVLWGRAPTFSRPGAPNPPSQSTWWRQGGRVSALGS
jgi:ribosomal protein L44E